MDEQKPLEVMSQGEPVVQLASLPVEPVKSKSQYFWSFVGANFLAISILTAGLMVSGALLYTNGAGAKPGKAQIVDDPQAKPGSTKVEVSVDDDPILGNKDAKVTIIEFSDYQCPFCRAFWRDSYAQIKRDYIDTGKARLVFRDYPLSFHPMAMPSAQAAECADEQGKYWEMHDKIFGEQEKLGQGTVTYAVADLKKWATSIGLDAGKFGQCLDSNKYKTEVEKDMADGSAAGVSGTPTLFINGRMVVGAQPYATFKALIEEELKKK